MTHPTLQELVAKLRAAREVDPPGQRPSLEKVKRLRALLAACPTFTPGMIELAYFLDSVLNAPEKARPLYEEGAAKALESLEDSWAGLLRYFRLEGHLEEALALAEKAERLFPESARLGGSVAEVRALIATRASRLPPSESE